MELDTLTAISPIDGRYRERTRGLAHWFSEQALMRYRLRVELEYFTFLCEVPLPELAGTPLQKLDAVRSRVEQLGTTDAQRIKAIEQVTNHDVKAIEYFLKERLEEAGLGEQREFVHFALTSQDINNTALPLLIKDFVFEAYLPAITGLRDRLHGLALDWARIPMLARTHGQPASPTALGKEIQVFVERLDGQLKLLREVPFTGKFGGATGNFNAHHAAYPELDWVRLADRFLLEKLGLQRQRFTTQIEHYDGLAALFDAMRRINTILVDLCRDMWQYISMDYFRQRIKAGEVGSSAMPHKVNPIDFENAEGNLGLASALFGFLSEKLPISRLQRDLTDSTVTRNIGVPMAHTMIAVDAIEKGLGKLLLNEAALERDLDAQWPVVAEGIQTILRRAGVEQPYEKLKDLTRGKERITQQDITAFIDTLDVSNDVRRQLKALSPRNYTGVDLLGR
ncbi:MAG: adenylosuccinate lyase [Flavobacteriales bacterium]|jgi:adenylosuccinate lyase|nr:MAG: adenylosuccinate lyase [Flavobacteriales bacterium]